MKYLEIFYSIQGEGLHVGHPSVFLRLFGCNFQCPMFGQDLKHPLPRDAMPHRKINPKDYSDVNDLPVFSIGCDSYASWDPRFKHLVKDEGFLDIADRLLDAIPETFVRGDSFGNKPDLVITGGEPLLKKNQEDLLNILELNKIQQTFRNITIETNGTQPLVDVDAWTRLSCETYLHFSISPKLSNSGVPKKKALRPDAVYTYAQTLADLTLKFVIRSEDQIPEVMEFLEAYNVEARCSDDNNMSPSDFEVYLMPEGGTVEELELTELEVANLCLKYGFYYSPRLHCNLFGNTFGT